VLPAERPADEHEQHRQLQQDSVHEVPWGGLRPKGSSHLWTVSNRRCAAVMGPIWLTRGTRAYTDGP